MTTTASARLSSPPARRVPPGSPPPTAPIAKGATARSAAASSRVPASNSPTARRGSLKAPINGESRDSLSNSLKQETEQKELLLVQLQDKDQTISSLTTENANLTSALSAAETRVNELYEEQNRSEAEMASRIDVSEKLRAQLRELEKEKRDLQRRYNEQTSTFEAERQAFYDNEQHLKSRIQSLSQARRQPEPAAHTAEPDSEAEGDEEGEDYVSLRPPSPKQDMNDPETEPAEMTSLRLELSTLSTSYSSLQSTLVLLQTQLVDLKRVNHELQEENESYMILLREKTLSGQFDIMGQVGGAGGSSEDDDDDDDDEVVGADNTGDVGSLKSTGRSILDRVEEEVVPEENFEPEETLEQELERSLESEAESPTRVSRHAGRQGRKRGSSTSHSPSSAPRGESLADLPITGPGLDLAAELGRAANKDILEGSTIDDRDRPVAGGKTKRGKKGSGNRKVSSSDTTALEPSASTNDLDALRTEVKSLKDANKALSLYASKIIDRIISQEGFEHVLAVDYDKDKLPPTPSTAGLTTITPTNVSSKPRPQSVMVGRSASNPTPNIYASNTPPLTAVPKTTPINTKRRSLSFDWKSFSIFSGTEKKPENPNLRPLTLTPGSSSVTGARKLDTYEDEEDRRERERLNATMKLMGIQPAPSPAIQRSNSSPASPPATANRRFSFFGAKTPDNSDATSVHSAPSLHGSRNGSNIGLGIAGASGLTEEALVQAEAENSLAALDAHERSLSADIARGASGGFTEISPRSRRSRRSAGGSGSGSTVWSAGMSKGEDDE